MMMMMMMMMMMKSTSLRCVSGSLFLVFLFFCRKHRVIVPIPSYSMEASQRLSFFLLLSLFLFSFALVHHPPPFPHQEASCGCSHSFLLDGFISETLSAQFPAAAGWRAEGRRT